MLDKILADKIVLWLRYSPELMRKELIPEIERNCVQYGMISETASDIFHKYKCAKNCLFFHHSYAEYDIPNGQEYELIASIDKGKIQPDSVERCRTKVLCFLSAFRTRPTDHAMRGHHELSLIQFEQGIPALIYELYEVTELKPAEFNQQICLCSEEALQLLL